MVRPLTGADGFVDDADPTQPRVVIQIDGGITLSDGERALRDVMVKEFVDALVTAIRTYYDARRLGGPFKRETDAAKLAAAIAETEGLME